MIQKAARGIEIAFDITLGAVRSLLLMIVITILVLAVILSGTIAVVFQIAN